MRSARFKLFSAALFFWGILVAAQAYAVEGNPSMEQLRADLSNIKTRLATIEAQQKEIIGKEEKILQELDRVRIWVHRK